MRTRFDTDSDASVLVNDVIVTYTRCVFRAEGVAPGDCYQYFDDEEEYERLRDRLDPEYELMVFEVALEFEMIPDLFFHIAEDEDHTCALTFSCDGYHIDNVSARLFDVDDEESRVVLGGEYELRMPS